MAHSDAKSQDETTLPLLAVALTAVAVFVFTLPQGDNTLETAPETQSEQIPDSLGPRPEELPNTAPRAAQVPEPEAQHLAPPALEEPAPPRAEPAPPVATAAPTPRAPAPVAPAPAPKAAAAEPPARKLAAEPPPPPTPRPTAEAPAAAPKPAVPAKPKPKPAPASDNPY